MHQSIIRVLLVERNPAVAERLRDILAGQKEPCFRVEWTDQVTSALDKLMRETFDVLMLSLELLKTENIAVFDQAVDAAQQALILVLSVVDDEDSLRQAIQHGAHDYLVKDQIDAYWTPRALRYLVDRKLAEDRQRNSELHLRQTEESLFEEKERAEVTLESIGDAVLVTDLSCQISYMNQVAEAMTGWSRADAMHQPITEVFCLIDSTTRMAATNPAQRAITENKAVELAVNAILIRRDGVELTIEDSSAPIHNRDGTVAGAVIVFHDVSESRAMARKMAHLAQHDFLTDLPNRMLLTERLERAIGMARRHHQQVAVMFLDLDDFKQINDTFGHAIGDQLLQSVAQRLVSCVRVTDTVCRQGGDEFVILLSEVAQPQGATRIADKLLAAFVAPHSIDGHDISISLSLGISIYPDDSSDVDSMMNHADTAMYYAKASGRNTFQIYNSHMF